MLRRLVGAVLGLGALAAVLWVPLWCWAPADWGIGWVALALTPYVAVGAAVVGLLALVARRWPTAVAAFLAAVVLAVLVAPRVVGGPAGGGPPGPGLVVATANLEFGRADAGEIVALVRTQRVEVLGLQEYTPDAESRLAAAGLFAALPYRFAVARPGLGGVALASRDPVVPSPVATGPATVDEVTARVATPGGPLDVVVTHPAAPVFRDDPAGWAQEIAGLPGPAPDAGPARLIMGDLNATLDHRPLRALLARGHRDAAAELGDGLVGTWPTDRAVPPFAAIDHLLLSGPLHPRAVSTHRIARTDHTALVATLSS